MNQCYRLGIDIGSTTVKVAVIDDNNKILFADYERHYANIQETLASLLKKCKGELGELSLRPNITGSGGLTLSGYLHIPFVQEVVAVATALQDYAPRTDVAIELGGEDAVTAIQGYTQMLLQSPELSEEDLDAAAVINERLNVLNQLLNQLFEFARIEADEMEFSYTTFDLNAVLRSVAVSFFKSFEERKIIPALSIAEISFPFYGDEKAVTRIFENIISNALSHGKSDYHFSSYDDNENYHFSFQNFTDSINESDIDKIFNRFYTTDLSRSRKTTGLGLTIAKNLTVKMGGSISASLNNNVFEIVVCFPKQKG